MARENLIKQTITIFTEIQRRLVDPTFKFSQGGATFKTLSNFLKNMEKEFGCVTKERMVDACVRCAYIFRESPNRSIKQIFGPASVKRIKDTKREIIFYENRWLESAQLNRGLLINMIADRSEHPQAKYIYVHSEEATKTRMLNQEVGYLLCQTSTLGWSPISEACQQCSFTERCKKETQIKFPELFRIRIEYAEGNK